MAVRLSGLKKGVRVNGQPGKRKPGARVGERQWQRAKVISDLSLLKDAIAELTLKLSQVVADRAKDIVIYDKRIQVLALDADLRNRRRFIAESFLAEGPWH